MPDSVLTISEDPVRIRGTNSTDASYPTRIPQIAEPSGLGNAAAQTTSGVIDLRGQAASGSPVQNLVKIIPYGAGSDTNTFLMRVIGWNYVLPRGSDATTPPDGLWVPSPIGEFTCTLSTPVGITGRTLISTDRICDTIAIVGTSGTIGSGIEIYSPADNTVAHVVIDMRGARKLEIIFDRNSSATSCNALVQKF